MNSARTRRSKRSVDTSEYLLMVARMLRGAARRVEDGDVEDLVALVQLRDQLDDSIVLAVRGLRKTGATWEAIGSSLGVTRQAALMRWGSKV